MTSIQKRVPILSIIKDIDGVIEEDIDGVIEGNIDEDMEDMEDIEEDMGSIRRMESMGDIKKVDLKTMIVDILSNEGINKDEKISEIMKLNTLKCKGVNKNSTLCNIKIGLNKDGYCNSHKEQNPLNVESAKEKPRCMGHKNDGDECQSRVGLTHGYCFNHRNQNVEGVQSVQSVQGVEGVEKGVVGVVKVEKGNKNQCSHTLANGNLCKNSGKYENNGIFYCHIHKEKDGEQKDNEPKGKNSNSNSNSHQCSEIMKNGNQCKNKVKIATNGQYKCHCHSK